MLMKKLLIWGAGDQGKVVLDCALCLKNYDEISMLAIKNRSGGGVMGYPLLKIDEEYPSIELLSEFDAAVVATGDNSIRLAYTEYLISNGVSAATLIHPSAVVSRFSSIGSGTVVLANAVINPFAAVGKACIVNTSVIVEHDCRVGDGVNLSPKAAMCGHVRVGNKSWLCTGCSIANDIIIGENAVVAAGAAVIKDVPDNVMVAGVPAVIKK